MQEEAKSMNLSSVSLACYAQGNDIMVFMNERSDQKIKGVFGWASKSQK